MHGKRLTVAAATVLAIGLLGSAGFGAATTPSQEQNMVKFKAAADNAVVGVVYGQNITKKDLEQALWDWMAPSTLDEYLNFKVVNLAMKKRGLSVTAADINKKMAEIKKTLPAGETMETMMQKMKYPMARFKSGMTIQIGLEKIIEKDNAPTAAEYADYVNARHILISIARSKPDATPEETKKAEDEAKVKADKVLAEIKAGKAFDVAAKEYSDDPGSKEKGGDLGWFQKGRMVPEFSEAAFKMSPGEISVAPVKSQYGYHIIQVMKVGKNASAAEKSELKKQIMEGKMQMLMRTTFDKLKEESKVKNMLSPTIPDAKPAMGMNSAPRPPAKPATAKPAPKPAPKP